MAILVIFQKKCGIHCQRHYKEYKDEVNNTRKHVWERQVLMKSFGRCKVNKSSGYGNRIPEEAVEDCIFRGNKDL